jgi:hypothetical protein
MNHRTTARTNNKRSLATALKGASDRYQRLLDRIRRAQDCAECREKRTVIVTKAYSLHNQVAFCAPCLSDMLCALCNLTHRRKH